MNSEDAKLTKNDEKLFRQLYENANEIYRFVAIRNRYDATPRDYGTGEVINMTEAHMVVDICDNESITVSKLAENSDRTPSAVSQIVSKIEKKGYIYKQRCTTNYKVYHLFPTDKGRQLCTAHKKYDIEQMMAGNAYLRKYCTEPELKAFSKVLGLWINYIKNAVTMDENVKK